MSDRLRAFSMASLLAVACSDVVLGRLDPGTGGGGAGGAGGTGAGTSSDGGRGTGGAGGGEPNPTCLILCNQLQVGMAGMCPDVPTDCDATCIAFQACLDDPGTSGTVDDLLMCLPLPNVPVTCDMDAWVVVGCEAETAAFKTACML